MTRRKTHELGRHNAPGGAVRAFKMADNSYRLEIHGALYTVMAASSLVLAIEDAQQDVERDSFLENGAQ